MAQIFQDLKKNYLEALLCGCRLFQLTLRYFKKSNEKKGDFSCRKYLRNCLYRTLQNMSGFDQFYYYHSNSIGAYRIKNRYIIFYSSIAKKGR